MTLDLDNLVRQARAGGPGAIRAAARLMTAMTDHPQLVGELLRGSDTWPQPRLILGITGAPGSGKSTLTDHLAAEYRGRYPDRRIGIVAVDPSSPFTGGALLGDRVRMMRHATDPMVFIRSLASRGHLGGLALGAKGVCRVMGLIGCDVVLVETVGVGQSEVEVAQNCDLTMVVLAPGQGDGIQLLKAGLMEAGDLFVVNKADREGAEQLYQSLLSTLRMEAMARQELGLSPANEPMPSSPHVLSINGHVPATSSALLSCQTPAGESAESLDVFLVSAAQHSRIGDLVDAMEKRTTKSTAQWQLQRRQQVVHELKQALLEEIRRRAVSALGTAGQADALIARVQRGEMSLIDLAQEVLACAARECVVPNAESEIPCQT